LNSPVTERLAEVIVVEVVRMVVRGVSALTRRIGRHSTAGLAVLPQQAWWWPNLMNLLDAAIRNSAAKGAS
jgi:hypothetical protein